MRPLSLADYVGQEHLTGADGVLKSTVENGILPSCIFWGPPGVGKTTLALILAQTMNRPFYVLSAINAGVKDIREVIDKAQKDKDNTPILFIDEIHRFSKSQQDSLLAAVEQGLITLIGATTENPSFEVIAPLLSRCRVYTLKELSKDDLIFLLKNALEKDFYLQKIKVNLKETDALLRYSGGDARKLLNILELAVMGESKKNGELVEITNQMVMHYAQASMARYDKSGEQHYDIISAFIKSIRGSDPNAAVYWLARMIEGGEDPKFIARRLIILASEDIGNANPTALVIATSCFSACQFIGYPECRIILSQCTIYLASSAKSNASYDAINKAQSLVKHSGDLPVPLHIRNAPTKLMKELGYGNNYQYAHSYEQNFVMQEFLPESIAGTTLYQPGNNARENELRNYLRKCWNDKYGY